MLPSAKQLSPSCACNTQLSDFTKALVPPTWFSMFLLKNPEHQSHGIT